MKCNGTAWSQMAIGVVVTLIGIYYMATESAWTRLENYVIFLTGIFFLLTALDGMKRKK